VRARRFGVLHKWNERLAIPEIQRLFLRFLTKNERKKHFVLCFLWKVAKKAKKSKKGVDKGIAL